MKIKCFLIFLIFLKSLGQSPNIQWQNMIGGSNNDFICSAIPTNDNGYLIGGSSFSNISGDKTQNSRGDSDYWIVKTDNFGNVLWNKTYGGTSPNSTESDFLTDLKQTADGGYILFGNSNSPISGEKTLNAINNSFDFWIIKINNSGIIEWQKIIGGDGDEISANIELTLDGGYLISGYSNSSISGDKTENSRGLQDYWILKLNNIGDIEWQKTIGGSGNEILRKSIVTNDGNYIISGKSNSNISSEKSENSKGFHDFWIVKINNFGAILWQKTIGGSGNEDLNNIIENTDGSYFIIGNSDSQISGDKTDYCRGFQDGWLVKIDDTGNLLWQKTIGGSDFDSLNSMILCSDGNYLLSFGSQSTISGDKSVSNFHFLDSWLMKIDPIGIILWQKNIGGLGNDGLKILNQTSDNSYFLYGGSDSLISGDIIESTNGLIDFWIMKLDSDNLSLNDNEINTSIEIAPNPTSRNFLVNFGTLQKNITVTITNLLGQVISKSNFNTVIAAELELQSEAGMYLVEIETENHQKSIFKVIRN